MFKELDKVTSLNVLDKIKSEFTALMWYALSKLGKSNEPDAAIIEPIAEDKIKLESSSYTFPNVKISPRTSRFPDMTALDSDEDNIICPLSQIIASLVLIEPEL